MVITVHDLTPIRRVEEMRADFVANASHELRTPLAALTGFIETLAGTGARRRGGARSLPRHHADAGLAHGAADRRPALAVADRAARASAAGDAGRPGADRAPGGRRPADAGARPRRRRSRSTPPAEPLVVLGDRDELIRLFENLIENGLKYGASGKRVEIALDARRSSDGKREARVSVRDHGPGIAAEHLPRLTERFYRVDVGESRAAGRNRPWPRAGQAHPQPPPGPAVDRVGAAARAPPLPCGCRSSPGLV